MTFPLTPMGAERRKYLLLGLTLGAAIFAVGIAVGFVVCEATGQANAAVREALLYRAHQCLRLASELRPGLC